MLDTSRHGDWRAICDRCGFEYWASELKLEWNGLRTCPEDWEPRQPQDKVRGVKDNQTVPWTRPDTDQFTSQITTLLTADAATSATSLAVASTANMTANNLVNVLLDTGDIHRDTIASIDSATGLTLTTGLAGPASSGNFVADLGTS